jgi:hypothetical protein
LSANADSPVSAVDSIKILGASTCSNSDYA